MKPHGCPGDAELVGFAQGALPAAAVERIAAHVTACERCRERLARMDEQPEDDLVVAIRKGTRLTRMSASVTPPRPAERHSGTVPDPKQGTSAAADAGDAPAGEGPGTRIGPYRLQQLLGEGGFGSVFLAEQTQPVRRQVALKLVKLGMDTRQVLARVQAERQALAMMDHPNIARVLDAGTSERGRPYFVMELARGLAITEYCDAHKLSGKRRLELFAQVCDAVQHAHTRGVIHRDLKPNNVIVTMRDGAPVPKVIDFGIAKAIGGRLTDATLFTEMRHFIGTPEYMSPEQAEGGALEVDGRTDVYSLGVLMYELLTGTTPFDAKELRAKGAEQIGRTIREVDPPSPSTRVGKMTGKPRSDVAASRATEPRKLTRSLRGELDWIVMKCLEKDRTLRYDNPAALGADVRRYLKDEPVRAGPPGAGYQVRKFVRRHRTPITVVGGMAAALLLGIGITLLSRGNTPGGAQNPGGGAGTQTPVTENAAHTARVDAFIAASPDRAGGLMDEIRRTPGGAGPIAAIFKRRMAAAPAGSHERLRSAVALALLGEPTGRDLVDAVGPAPAAESRLLIAGLASAAAPDRAGAAELVALLKQRADDAKAPLRTRARHAIALLFLGQDAASEAMLAEAPDPTPRSAWVAEFEDWHGELSKLPEIAARVSPAARSGVILGAGKADPAGLPGETRDAVVAALASMYVRDPSAGVHAACEYALRRWKAEVPAAVPQGDAAAPTSQWHVGKSGITMVRVPSGFAVLGDDRDNVMTVATLFTRPLYVAATEVPHALFKQFADDPAVPEADRPTGWLAYQARLGKPPEVSVAGVSIAEAARFCNWLSGREGLTPCYAFEGPQPAQWRFDPAADGYRLPNAAEWEYAARAGATTRYPCSDDDQYLGDVARVASSATAEPVQPNRWGLFDTIGGMAELCWDVDLLNQGGEPQQPGTTARPVADPKATDGGRFAVARGGGIGSGANELRVFLQVALPHDGRHPTVGFRVARAALPGDAPPEVAAPEDLGELWMRAIAMRPSSPGIATRASQFRAAWGQVHGRFRRWAEAEAAFHDAAKFAKNDPTLWWYVALVRLQLNDAAGHRAAVDAMRTLVTAGETPGGCDRVAKMMLINPATCTGEDLNVATRFAAAFELGGRSHHGWFVLIDGYAKYRLGQYGPAIASLEEAKELLASRGGQIEIDLLLAMSLHGAGRKDEAKAAFERGDRLLREAAPPDAADWDLTWVEGALGWQLHPQAERLLKQ